MQTNIGHGERKKFQGISLSWNPICVRGIKLKAAALKFFGDVYNEYNVYAIFV